MKASVPVFALLAVASAQNFKGVPECAIDCLKKYIPQAGCKIADTGCQCTSDFQAKLQPIILSCLTSSCSVSDLVKAQQANSKDCAEYQSTATAGTTGTTSGTSGTSGTTSATTATTATTATSETTGTTSGTTSTGTSSTNAATTTSTGTSTAASVTAASTTTSAPAAGAPYIKAAAAIAAILAL